MAAERSETADVADAAPLPLLGQLRREIVTGAGWCLLLGDRDGARAAVRAWSLLGRARSGDDVDQVLGEVAKLTECIKRLNVKTLFAADGITSWE